MRTHNQIFMPTMMVNHQHSAARSPWGKSHFQSNMYP